MIIKSKVKTFGFCYSFLGIIFSICMVVYLCLARAMDFPPRIFSLFVAIVFLASFGKFLWDGNIIIIDTDGRTINFRNRLTRVAKHYDIDYFDGYVFTYEPMKFNSIKNLYLVKDRIFIKKISAFIYSNHSEIEEGLISLKNLGEVKYTHWNSFKIFIGRPII